MEDNERLDSPPVVQMMLTAHFGPSIDSLTMLDVASIFDEYRERYPLFQQTSIVGPMTIELTPPQGFDTVESSALPRAMMSTEDQEYSVLFQTDRISFGWNRQAPLSESATYPGFTDMRQSFIDELAVFRSWLKERSFPDVAPDVVELAYHNAFNLAEAEEPRRVGDIVTFFCNPRKALMANLSVNWVEPLRPGEDQPDNLSGVIRVQSGVGVGPNGERVLLFNMIGLAAVDGKAWDKMVEALGEVHERIVQIFKGSIQPRHLKVKA